MEAFDRNTGGRKRTELVLLLSRRTPSRPLEDRAAPTNRLRDGSLTLSIPNSRAPGVRVPCQASFAIRFLQTRLHARVFVLRFCRHCPRAVPALGVVKQVVFPRPRVGGGFSLLPR